MPAGKNQMLRVIFFLLPKNLVLVPPKVQRKREIGGLRDAARASSPCIHHRISCWEQKENKFGSSDMHRPSDIRVNGRVSILEI